MTNDNDYLDNLMNNAKDHEEYLNERREEERNIDPEYTEKKDYRMLLIMFGVSLICLALVFLALSTALGQDSTSTSSEALTYTEEARYTGAIINVWSLQITDAEYDWMKKQKLSECRTFIAKKGDTWEGVANKYCEKYQLLKMLNYVAERYKGEMPELKEGDEYKVFLDWL